MKKIAALIMIVAGLTFVVAHAQPLVGEEGAKKSSDGKVIYPKEIENCEPCKRLWLANNLKHKKSTDVQDKKTDGAKTGGAVMDVKKTP